MQIIEKEEYPRRKDEIISLLEKGHIFVYPTDTIYGIGCDATNHDAVKKVRDIKIRHDKPFSVIAPSKQWIEENFHISPKDREWLDKLPGPYTLILKLKNGQAIAESVSSGYPTLGVRMPDHWITDMVAAFGKPVITPSANVNGTEFMTSKEDLDPRLKAGSHILLYEGEKRGQPSTIVNLAETEIHAAENRKII